MSAGDTPLRYWDNKQRASKNLAPVYAERQMTHLHFLKHLLLDASSSLSPSSEKLMVSTKPFLTKGKPVQQVSWLPHPITGSTVRGALACAAWSCKIYTVYILKSRPPDVNAVTDFHDSIWHLKFLNGRDSYMRLKHEGLTDQIKHVEWQFHVVLPKTLGAEMLCSYLRTHGS